jgi:Cu/Zn superoxide dismutase
MKTKISCCLFFAVALTAFASIGLAQIVQFNATITGAQETPATGSASTGTATLLYNVATNTFNLTVTVNNFPNTLTNSHIHEAAAGVPGNVVTPLGAEPLYTRSGNTLTGSFFNLTYGGTPATLLQNGAYINFHSAAFPNGEIRGQLIAQPKRLVANLTTAQEQAAFPTVNLSGVNDYGAAVMSFNPGTNQISLRVSVYNFNNAMNNSHFHEGAPGVSGAVVTALGSATSAGYAVVGNWITGTFDIPYTGDPIKLLTGGAYINFHSTAFPAADLRTVVVGHRDAAEHGADDAEEALVGAAQVEVARGAVRPCGSSPARRRSRRRDGR